MQLQPTKNGVRYRESEDKIGGKGTKGGHERTRVDRESYLGRGVDGDILATHRDTLATFEHWKSRRKIVEGACSKESLSSLLRIIVVHYYCWEIRLDMLSNFFIKISIAV